VKNKLTLKEDFQLIRDKMRMHVILLNAEISERQNTIRYMEASIRILETEEKLLSVTEGKLRKLDELERLDAPLPQENKLKRR
jgi:hypothetical protein